jgi:hypothetical protein
MLVPFFTKTSRVSNPHMKPSFSLRTLGLSGLILAAGAVTAIPVTLNLTTDTFGGETSFEMVVAGDSSNIPFASATPPQANLDDGIAASGELFSDTDYIFQWDLAPGNYAFTINDTFGDGISSGGAYTLITPTETFVGDPDFGTSATTNFSLSEDVPVPATLALLGLGLAGFGWSRSRARS